MTPLDKTLKRALSIKGVDFVVTLSPDALKLTRKGKRLGVELKWEDITSGESALAVALRASVGRFDSGAKSPPKGRRRGAAVRPAPKKRRS
jgi:hypothetical protein